MSISDISGREWNYIFFYRDEQGKLCESDHVFSSEKEAREDVRRMYRGRDITPLQLLPYLSTAYLMYTELRNSQGVIPPEEYDNNTEDMYVDTVCRNDIRQDKSLHYIKKTSTDNSGNVNLADVRRMKNKRL